MKSGALLVFLFLGCILKAQNNGNCANAIQITSSEYGPAFVYKPSDDAPLSVGVGVVPNTAWFKFYIAKDTTLVFEIKPINPKDDYDFDLYQYSSANPYFLMMAGVYRFSELILEKKVKPIRYCYSQNFNNAGCTGLSVQAKVEWSLPGPNPAYVKALKVKKGELFYLAIHNLYNATGKGFYIKFFDPKVIADIIPIVIPEVHFETGSDQLLKTSYSALDSLKKVLVKNPGMEIQVEGHTDSIGNIVANKKLSELRAKAVVDYLVKKGVDKARLSYIGYGSERPALDNKTEKSRLYNRRVEFIIKKEK